MSFQMGTPSVWPMRSQDAMSNAASADWLCSLGRPYSSRSMAQASRSVSNGSAPMTYRPASSSTTATNESVLLTGRTSPTPTSPSSVSSSTKTRSRHGVPTTVVLTLVTCMGLLVRPGRRLGGLVAAVVQSGASVDDAGYQNDAPVRLLADRLRRDAGVVAQRQVDPAPLQRGHRLELEHLAGLDDARG